MLGRNMEKYKLVLGFHLNKYPTPKGLVENLVYIFTKHIPNFKLLCQWQITYPWTLFDNWFFSIIINQC
jgi:hypothetical protein